MHLISMLTYQTTDIDISIRIAPNDFFKRKIRLNIVTNYGSIYT